MNGTMLVIASKALLSLAISVQIASLIVRYIERKRDFLLPIGVLFALIFVIETVLAYWIF